MVSFIAFNLKVRILNATDRHILFSDYVQQSDAHDMGIPLSLLFDNMALSTGHDIDTNTI